MKSEHRFIRCPRRYGCVPALLLAALLTGCSFIEIRTPEDTSAPAFPDSDTADTETSADTGEKQTSRTPAETGPDAEKTAADALAALRTRDFDGMNFLLAAVDTCAAFGSDTEGTVLRSETLDVIRETRRQWVEDKYNTHILTFSYTKEELFSEVSQAYLSDAQYVADFYAIPAEELGRYQANGYLLNLRSLPFTDYTQPYFNRAGMAQFSAGYGVWAAVGDYTEAPENLWGVYFNKTLAADLGLDSPYDLVRDGTWTWEKYYTYARTAYSTANGIFGDDLGLLPVERCEALVWGTYGVRTANTGRDTVPTPASDAVCSSVQEMADLIFERMYRGTTMPEAGQDGAALFDAGKLLFSCGGLSMLAKRPDIGVDWGIVPLPKPDESAPYRSGCGDLAVLCVPSVTGEPEKTGLLLQALFAASGGAYRDAFLNDALAYTVRDSDSVDMLDIILSNIGYDFASAFSSGYPALSAVTVGGLHRTVTTKNTFTNLWNTGKADAAAELLAAFRMK